MEDVEFARDGSFAYRPGEMLIPEGSLERTIDEMRASPPSDDYEQSKAGAERVIEGWVRLEGVPRLLTVIDRLRRRGIAAQPNHVLFATCGCGCGPHPASPHANPFYANPFYANPFYANPFYANPFYANPFYANPFYANPFYANPFYANPFYANPFYANPNPGRLLSLDAERRESSARPVEAPSGLDLPDAKGSIRVTVLDTGFRHEDFGIDDAAHPGHVVVNPASDFTDVPDAPESATVAEDGYLDPAAGHGTFIAGVIRQVTSVCDITVLQVLSTHGVGDEASIAAALDSLPSDDGRRPDFLNLSFGGYSSMGMATLADAIERITASGTVVVASAGNDGTCVPMYPAALPVVVAVGAVDGDDHPADFSNFGPWVRACSLGVDVESAFFEWDGAEPPDAEGVDIDEFEGWATWSGTSFAAPRVVAVLAQWLADNPGAAPHDAVEAVIDDPDQMRIPMMGTLVEPSGDHWHSVRMATRRRDPGS